MVKADLVRAVYERHGGITYQEAQQIVEVIIEHLKTRLLAGENVKLTRFGTFVVVERKPRLGRNPQTGERIQLDASRHITFRPSRSIEF